MCKIIRFFDMTVTIPMKDGETAEEIEDRLIEAVESAGARFSSYKTEFEDEEDDQEDCEPMDDDKLDKDTPMKIIGHRYCRCGRCGAMLFEGKERCDNCGQMIDWSTR